MICHECKTPEQCKWHVVAVAAPLECSPCFYCGQRNEMYAEIPVQGDHDGSGFVMRIGCLCPKSLGFDNDNRTEFDSYDNAITAWDGIQEDRKESAS